MRKYLVTLFSVLLLIGVVVVTNAHSSKKLDRIRVRFPIGKTMPDPANIIFTGDWYVLGHISSGLIHFNSTLGKFEPLLASHWEILDDNTHRFYLRPDVTFSDGSPITANDVVASLKRLVMKKSSTHFPLWEYVIGCSSLTNLTDDCVGLKAKDSHTVDVRLNGRFPSFLLQLASPETGIWAKSDINSESLEIKATRYSGPYTMESFNSASAIVLKRNPLNLVSQAFPESPERIVVSLEDMKICEEQLAKGELDILARNTDPFNERDWSATGVRIMVSAPSTLIFFGGVTAEPQKAKIALDALKVIWERNPIKDLIPAKSLLPFGEAYKIDIMGMNDQMPKKTSPEIRLAIPHTYFAKGFIDFLRDCFREVGSDLKIVVLSREEYPKIFTDPRAIERVDYILTPYAASERYPAVQLRFMTGANKNPPIDLKKAETPELNDEQIETLKAYQRWLIRDGHVVPVFFASTLIMHRESIDLGIQEAPDSEIEFWRVKRM